MDISGDYSLPARIKCQHRLFARRLLPLTPRRIDLLCAFGLDSLFQRKTVDRIDLRQLALIFSIKNPGRLYRRMHPLHPLTLLWRLRTKLFRTTIEAHKLDCYLADYTAVPELWRQQQEGGARAPKQLTAPWLLAQCLAYQKLTACADPWEVPLDVMAWELATLTEAEGGSTRFVTDHDREVAAQVGAAPEPTDADRAAYAAWQQGRASTRRGV